MRRKTYMGVELYFIMALIPFLIVPETFIGNAVYLSMGFIVFTILKIYYIQSKNIEVVYKRNETIVGAALTVLFIIMISIFDILNSDFLDIDALSNIYPSGVAHVMRVWGYLIYLPSVFIASFIVVRSLVHAALENDTSDLNTGGGISKKTYRLCFGIISLTSVFYLFSTYPGIWIEADVATVWNQVCGQNWNAWHTLGYQLFVALCSFFMKSSFAVNIVDTILWILLHAYILNVLREKNEKSMKVYTAALLFTSIPFNYLEVMYKDVVFSMGMLAIIVGIYHIIKSQKILWQDILALMVGGVFVGLCRHAGTVVVLLGLISVFLFFFCKRKKEIWKYLAGILIFQIACFWFVNVALMESLNATENPSYVKYSIPLVTIGAAASRGVEFEQEEKKILEKIMPIEEWGNCYNKYWADDLSRGWGKIGNRINTVGDLIDNEQYGRDLLKINLKLLKNHPYIYIKSIFDMNNIIWKMATPNDGYEWPIGAVAKNEEITYLSPFKYTNQWTLFMYRTPLTNTVYARGGVALFLILFTGTIWFLQKKRDLLIALIPIIVYDSMLLITIPSQDPRFVLPGIECAIFLTAVVFGEGREKDKKSVVVQSRKKAKKR